MRCTQRGASRSKRVTCSSRVTPQLLSRLRIDVVQTSLAHDRHAFITSRSPLATHGSLSFCPARARQRARRGHDVPPPAVTELAERRTIPWAAHGGAASWPFAGRSRPSGSRRREPARRCAQGGGAAWVCIGPDTGLMRPIPAPAARRWPQTAQCAPGSGRSRGARWADNGH